MNLIKSLLWRLVGRRSEYDYYSLGYRETSAGLTALTGCELLKAISLRRQELKLLRAFTDPSVKARCAGMEKALIDIEIHQLRSKRK